MTGETNIPCKACGKLIPADARFCPGCGRPIKPQLSLGKRFLFSLLRTLLWLALIWLLGFIISMHFRIEELKYKQQAAEALNNLQHMGYSRHLQGDWEL